MMNTVQPKKSSRSVDRQQSKMGDSTSTKFLFVTSTGKARPRHDAERRRHVMQQSSVYPANGRYNDKPAPQRGDAAGRITFQLNQNVREARNAVNGHTKPVADDTRMAENAITTRNVDAQSVTQLGTRDESTRSIDRILLQDPPGMIRSPHDQVLRGGRYSDVSLERQVEASDTTTTTQEAFQELPTSPLVFFGTARIDPFGVLPFKLSAWDEVLLARFSYHKKWPWCPVSGQSQWSPFAMTDEMVFSATMFSWSMAFRHKATEAEAASWLDNNPEVLSHKLKAIVLINKNLSSVDTAVSDGTIAAVAALANLELIFGSYEAASYHISGLRRLVQMRGGFHLDTATPLQQLIYRLISWTGLVYSNVYKAPLYFPALQLWDKSWKALDSLSIPGSPICFTPRELWNSGVDNYEAVDILETIRHLCQLEQDRPLQTLSEHESMLRSDMCSSLEVRLTRIVNHSGAAAASYESYGSYPALPKNPPGALEECRRSTWNSALWQSIALAAQIYIHHFLRGTDLSAKQFRVWAHSLRRSLDDQPEYIKHGDDPDNWALNLHHRHDLPTKAIHQFFFSRSLLFWVLSLGAIASASQSFHSADLAHRYSFKNSAEGAVTTDHEFFIDQLRHVQEHYSLDWQSYLSSLRGFFWTGHSNELVYWNVWKEVQLVGEV